MKAYCVTLEYRGMSNYIVTATNAARAEVIARARYAAGENGDSCGSEWERVEDVQVSAVPRGDHTPDPRGVVELEPDDPRATVCGACGRGWDDTVSTSCTPTPSGRCPFEGEHDREAEEIEQEDLEAASELLAKLEAGQLQCGCDPSSCDHKYLGDEPGPYPRDRRVKKGT